MNSVLDAARAYVQRGYKPVPVPFGKKRPILDAWQALRLNEEMLPEHFNGRRQNIGLLCGEPSGNLADVDCDCREAADAARLLLPQTGMKSGRKSRPDSHYWYILTGDAVQKTVQFEDILGTAGSRTQKSMLIELRFTGGQTIVPPSVHPEGELYEWNGQEPATIDGEQLLQRVKRVAATALLARHWQAQGTRHTSSLALAGFLLRGSMPPEEAAQFIANAAQVAGHDDIDDRVKSVWDTYERLKNGEPSVGFTKLKEYLPEGVLKKLENWLGLSQPRQAAQEKHKKQPRGSAFTGDEDAGEEAPDWSTAQMLVKFGEAANLFHNDRQEAFARFEINGHKETWPVRNRSFRNWLCRQFYEATEKPPNATAMEDALRVLEAKSQFDGREIALQVRIARHEDAVWIDLTDEQWRAVKVTAEGWEVVDDPPPLFRRYTLAAPQVEPKRGGSLDLLRDFLNVKDEAAWRQVIAWTVAAFLPDIAHAVLVTFGEQGSAKSTLIKLLSRLVDPSRTPLRSEPRDIAEWVQAADHSWLVALDNVSILPPWLSDAICRAVYDEGFSKRQLYTDAEDVILCFRRVIALNGIECVAQRPDLLDRSLLLGLEPIPIEKRRSETEVIAAFEQVRPLILGALLDVLAGVLRELPNVHLDRLPRMADFAMAGCTVERVLNWPEGSFLEAYAATIASSHEEALSASLVGEAVLSFVDKAREWQGTATALRDALDAHIGDAKTKQREWPKTPKGLSGQLRRIAPNLRAVGVFITFTKPGKERLITLSRTDGIFASDASDASAPISNEPSDPTQDTELSTQTIEVATQKRGCSDAQ